MKKKKSKNEFTKRDEIQAENAVIKLKLETEFGAMINQENNSNLPPEIENNWLNSVYNFEQNYKNAKSVTVYELIGKPAFKKIEELKNKKEISKELNRIQKLMEEKNIVLYCICEYKDDVIYKFITEELFLHETDDMQMPGWVTTYIYEEFHPNHVHDLKQRCEEFLKALFEKEWEAGWQKIYYADQVKFNDKSLSFAEFSTAIELIQSIGILPCLDGWVFTSVEFDLEKETAKVKGNIQFSETKFDYKQQKREEPFIIIFELKFDFWSITKILIPFLNEA